MAMLIDNITTETRAESNGKVDRAKRYMQIMSILKGKNLTAKEVAIEMYKKGFVPTAERNHSAPRLTELVSKGKVKVIGKTKCEYTGKTVAVYSLVEESNND
jgi:hypothetical protein